MELFLLQFKNFYYNSQKKELAMTCSSIVHEGYVVEWLLNNYYFPIIYHLLTDKHTLLIIWREMSLEKHHLKKVDCSASVFANGDDNTIKQLRNEYNIAFNDLFKQYDDNNLSYECVIMEVYKTVNDGSAHVAALVDGKYVIDREKCCTIHDYITQELLDCAKLRFDYVNKQFPKHIHGVVLTRNIYSYEYKPSIHGASTLLLSGGAQSYDKNKLLIMLWLALFVSVIIIIVVIIQQTHSCKHICCNHHS